MGMYINPAVSEEASKACLAINPAEAAKDYWLRKHAARVTMNDVVQSLNNYDETKDNLIVLCHVNNGLFTAIAVAYDRKELAYFLNIPDTRVKDWYLADPKDVIDVLPMTQANDLRRICGLNAQCACGSGAK